MAPLLVKRTALLQAKLQMLEERKEYLADHAEILAFHRLKQQFDALLSRRSDQLGRNPLEAVQRDFENDKTLIEDLRRIANEAKLALVALKTQKADYLTPEFLQRTFD